MSKVLIINGSPRLNGNTAIAVREMEKVFHENGVEVTTIQIGNKDIKRLHCMRTMCRAWEVCFRRYCE